MIDMIFKTKQMFYLAVKPDSGKGGGEQQLFLLSLKIGLFKMI